MSLICSEMLHSLLILLRNVPYVVDMLRNISYAIDMLQLLCAPFAMNWYVLKCPICHWYVPITLCSICYELICSEMSYLPLICSNYSMLHSLWIKYVLNDMIRMIWYLLRWYPWEFLYSALHYDTLLVWNRSFCSEYALSLAEPFLAHSVVI